MGGDNRPKWLTVGQAVQRFHGLASGNTVRRMADAGKFQVIRISARGDRRLLAEDVDRAVIEMEQRASGGDLRPHPHGAPPESSSVATGVL